MLSSHGHCGRFVNNAFVQTNRKVILWVDSIPTPGKSKIMSEIKVRTENTEVSGVPFFYFLSWRVSSSTGGQKSDPDRDEEIVCGQKATL